MSRKQVEESVLTPERLAHIEAYEAVAVAARTRSEPEPALDTRAPEVEEAPAVAEPAAPVGPITFPRLARVFLMRGEGRGTFALMTLTAPQRHPGGLRALPRGSGERPEPTTVPRGARRFAARRSGSPADGGGQVVAYGPLGQVPPPRDGGDGGSVRIVQGTVEELALTRRGQ